MRLQMAAIALVSAMLGGVFGVAVWRVVGDRGEGPANASKPAPSAGHWYCYDLGEKLTSCVRTVDDCEKQMSKAATEEMADVPCVAVPIAWCGQHHCTEGVLRPHQPRQRSLRVAPALTSRRTADEHGELGLRDAGRVRLLERRAC
jgi:hypothetical protein